MRLSSQYELRYLQALFLRYKNSPGILEVLKERFGFRRVSDSDPSVISGEAALQLSEWLHTQGDPHALAWIASVIDLGAGNGLTYYLRAHTNLEQALMELSRLGPMLFPDARFACETTNNQLRLLFYPTDPERLGVLLRYEAICIWMARVMQEITGGKITLTQLELMTHAQADTTTLKEILPAPCVLGASQFSLIFSIAELRLHLPGASEPLKTHLYPMFEKRIARAQRCNTIVSSVAQWLDGQANLTDVRLETAARQLGMGASTLRRQLADFGCSFSEILKSHRAFIAIHALIHEDENSDSIASHTGYADRNAFERAFKGWFDVSPAQCRRAARELLGRNPNREWEAPYSWLRYSPKIAWLRKELVLPNANTKEICEVIEADPVLHARIAGFCAMPTHGARMRMRITPELLSEIPNSALSALIERSASFDSGHISSPEFDVWQTSRIAVDAARIIGNRIDVQGLPAVELAASVFNLGTLARPSISDSTVDGIDTTWLLLAAWHVPPSILRLLRGRHSPRNNAELTLSLAIRWAQSTAAAHEAEHRQLHTSIRSLCGHQALNQLLSLAPSMPSNWRRGARTGTSSVISVHSPALLST